MANNTLQPGQALFTDINGKIHTCTYPNIVRGIKAVSVEFGERSLTGEDNLKDYTLWKSKCRLLVLPRDTEIDPTITPQLIPEPPFKLNDKEEFLSPCCNSTMEQRGENIIYTWCTKSVSLPTTPSKAKSEPEPIKAGVFIPTLSPKPTKPTKANEIQHGGTHYKSMSIEPWDYIARNNIPYLEGSAIKYISRWRDKGGIEDLKKAIHFIEKVIELESETN